MKKEFYHREFKEIGEKTEISPRPVQSKRINSTKIFMQKISISYMNAISFVAKVSKLPFHPNEICQTADVLKCEKVKSLVSNVIWIYLFPLLDKIISFIELGNLYQLTIAFKIVLYIFTYR